MSRNLIGKPHHGSGRAVSMCIYRSTGLAAPTHNGIWQCDGPRLVLLGEPTAPPSPDRDVAAVCGLAVRHPIPRHPAPYGLPPNMSESSGTPGANNAPGSFALVFPQPSLARASLGCSHLFWGWGMGVEQKTSFGSISCCREPSRYFCCNGGLAFCSTMAQPSAKSAFYKCSVMTSANSPFAESSQ